YVCDPSKLHEEYTRYHFFLQLKKDILDGKLIVPSA
ncbi:Tyrosine-protein phosphatase non-receptor type 4, partial [Stegodyphus mimosarum]